MTKTRIPTWCAIMLAASAGMPSAARADPRQDITVNAPKKVGESNVVEVSYADLDLSQRSQVRQLRHRVWTAAGQVCAPRLYTPELSAFDQNACVLAALDDAGWQIRRAEKRARELRLTGRSSIAPVAIAIRAAF